MIGTLIAKEIKEMLGSPKFVFTFAVVAILIIAAFVVGASNYRTSRVQYEASKAQNLRQMEGLTDWLSVEQHRIFMPPTPLAALVSGVSHDIGRTIEMRARGEMSPYDSHYNEDPVFAVFRFLDLEFVFQVVLALLAILLGYDAVCGEKERGTLRLVFSNAVSRSTYILAKLIGSFIGPAIALLIAIGLGSLLLPLMGVPMTGSDWLKLGLIVIAGLLYFGVFLTLAVFVSSVTQRTSSSFLILLVIWIGCVVVVPRASVLLAGRAVDVPSVDELATRKSVYSAELWDEFRKGLTSFSPAGNGDMNKMMTRFNQYMDSLSQIRDGKMDELAARLNEQRANAQRHQQEVAFAIARVSPAASLSLATSYLAGTSIELTDDFCDAARQYQTDYAAFLKEKTGINVGGAMVVARVWSDDMQEPDPINPYELPEFSMPERSLANVLQRASIDLGLLALFNLVCFVAAITAFLRYDLR